MARHKMTEEEKIARRLAKQQAFDTVEKHLKHLTFAELDEVIALAQRYKKEQLGREELRLIKEKEVIELQLQKLKDLDVVK
jgi:aminoglycoside N3'-acetyltransferase